MAQGRRSDGWEGAGGEERSNGWPLGMLHRLSMASATSTFLVSTPSLTSSSSSSDFDTESTGSFFPERSTTLGSLIGIQASSQLASMEEDASSTGGDTTRRKRGNNRSRTCWSLLSCGGGLQNDTLDFSPSLAHFLGRERGESLSQGQTTGNGIEHTHVGQEQEQDQGQEEDSEEEQGQGPEQAERFHSTEVVSHRSGLYNNGDTTAARPCGQSLRLILQQPSPTCYLSTDWNVFTDLSQNDHLRRSSNSDHGRFHTFWPGLCCR